MQLSQRLKVVADMVSKGNRVADIGCDHAYVSIYLIRKGIASKVIALDINKGPIKKADENIKNYGVSEFIETRLSDGAKQLQPKEADTLLMAGMGGALMVKILTDSKEVVDSCEELILQPQSEVFLVRKFLGQIGFQIVDEDMIIEDKKYYVMIKARKALKKDDIVCHREVCYRYGKVLLEKKSPVLRQFLLQGLEGYEELIEELRKSKSERAGIRIQEITKDIEYIKEGLDYYEM